MADVRIPPVCVFCKVHENHAEYKYPLKGDDVLTRVAWQGFDEKGVRLMTWESAAGNQPSRVRFPAVAKFIPVAAWCPSCLVAYHIGPVHPADEKAANNNPPGPKLVKP